MKRLILIGCLLLAGCATIDAATQPTPAPITAAERGRALFMNKGCATCHVNSRADPTADPIDQFGPNLTRYTNDPAFLRQWLADPSAIRPGTPMPDLDLAPSEIDDLIAFLNEPR